MTHLTAESIKPLEIDEARKQEEIDFHNRRERDRQELDDSAFENVYTNKKWYSVTRRSRQFADRWFEQHCPGAVALDYCCGLGGSSLRMARSGAFVHGIDISDESVGTAARCLADAGLAERSSFQVMDAENMTFPDDTFDVILCCGVLHHLDLANAYPELARVLKPTGRILCIEALGHNPLINLYRRRTPQLRTAWEVDHIIKKSQLDQARDYFDRVQIDFFHLATIAAVPLRRSRLFQPLLSLAEWCDHGLLKLPFVKWMAWQTVFEFSQPKTTLAKAA